MGLDQELDEDFKTHDLAVGFSLPSAGWIRCKIRPMHEKFAISCTYLWDPFKDFIVWLEAIANGSDSTTWLVDQEGSCSRLQFYGGSSSVDDPADYLLHLRSYGSLERIRGMRVERRQLVESFYTAFRAMTDSPDYIPREWERHPDYPSLDIEDDDEYEAAVRAFPYGGYNLREMRSSVVEAYLTR